MTGALGLDLQSAVDEAAHRLGVPGASVAVWRDGEMATCATGIANIVTGVPVTVDTLFQVGSISKVHTATLVADLVVRGRLGLDTPVVAVVPELRDSALFADVSVGQLLAHTSGVDGDLYVLDSGRGYDAVARYVESCRELQRLFPAGDLVSYCNAGYVVLGRLLEHEWGLPWEDVVRARLFEPAGLGDSTLFPEEVILRRHAVGHFPARGEVPYRLAPVWAPPRSMGPTGASMCATASDLARFAALHVEALGGQGSPAVSAEAAAAMREAQPPRRPGCEPRGLGWELMQWGDRSVLSHDGATVGQTSALRVVPSHRLCIAVLCNWARGPRFHQAVIDAVLAELGIPGRPVFGAASVATAPELETVTGVYERRLTRYEVATAEGALVMASEIDGRRAEHRLRCLGGPRFGFDDPIFGELEVRFLSQIPAERPDMLSLQGRVARRRPPESIDAGMEQPDGRLLPGSDNDEMSARR